VRKSILCPWPNAWHSCVWHWWVTILNDWDSVGGLQHCRGGWPLAEKPRRVSFPLPSGEAYEWDYLEDFRVYADVDRNFLRLTAWEPSSRCAIERESIHVGAWCTCIFWDHLRRRMMSFVKKARVKQATTVKGVEAKDPVFLRRCPALHEFLTLTAVDGVARATSSISLFADGGRWKASLADKDAEASLYVTADSVDGLLDALEEAAKDPDADWRVWRSVQKKKGKN
jgi:hypothetical protein